MGWERETKHEGVQIDSDFDAVPRVETQRWHGRRKAVMIIGAVLVAGYGGQRLLQNTNTTSMAAQEDAIIVEQADKLCSAKYKDCKKTKCCKDAGLQCFAKNRKWATCMPECSKGFNPVDKEHKKWRCKALGPRTPGPIPAADIWTKPAAWVQEKCAATGENCEKKACCKDKGKQCYKKNDKWFGCKETCVPGPDPMDSNNASWDCARVGMRTPGPLGGGVPAKWVKKYCAAKNKNCMKSRCCKDLGHQCFMKTKHYGTCMKECVPGPFLADANSDIWNCTAMGGRTPGYAAATSPSQYVAKWVKKNCSKVGENCQKTMCCADETNQCYEKNKKWASCSRGCKPGIHKDDKDKKKWSCRPLGPRTPRKWKSPTLYCYSVIRLQTYEADILRMQAKTDGGIGIFGCDEYDVFAAQGRGWIGDGPNGPVWTHHFVDAAVTRSIDNTAGNTQLFRNVWHAVKLVGKWQFTEWTVKMDPDAVLFAPRLRSRLKPHTKNIPVFFQNCASYTLVQQGGAMMFGSVEVISHLGISKYLNIEESACKFGDQYGEDRWFGECLKSLGVYPITDPGILGDKLCVPGVFDCANGEKRAAYHFYKDVGSWMNCYHQGVSAGI